MFDYRDYLDDEKKVKLLYGILDRQNDRFEKYLLYHGDSRVELMEKRVEMMEAFFKQYMNEDPEQFMYPPAEEKKEEKEED